MTFRPILILAFATYILGPALSNANDAPLAKYPSAAKAIGHLSSLIAEGDKTTAQAALERLSTVHFETLEDYYALENSLSKLNPQRFPMPKESRPFRMAAFRLLNDEYRRIKLFLPLRFQYSPALVLNTMKQIFSILGSNAESLDYQSLELSTRRAIETYELVRHEELAEITKALHRFGDFGSLRNSDKYQIAAKVLGPLIENMIRAIAYNAHQVLAQTGLPSARIETHPYRKTAIDRSNATYQDTPHDRLVQNLHRLNHWFNPESGLLRNYLIWFWPRTAGDLSSHTEPHLTQRIQEYLKLALTRNLQKEFLALGTKLVVMQPRDAFKADLSYESLLTLDKALFESIKRVNVSALSIRSVSICAQSLNSVTSNGRQHSEDHNGD